VRIYPTKESYREAWQKAYHEDPPIPLNVDIELASICNLACPMCYWGDSDFSKSMNVNDSDGGKKKRFMPIEMAKRLIDECVKIGVPALKMNFRGESTLHPQYRDIMIYARQRIAECTCCKGGFHFEKTENGAAFVPAFHEVLVNTNANSPAESVDGLMAATKVMVSLDSMDPIIYPQIRVNGRLERALEVIAELKERGHPDVWVRRVVTRLNKDEPFVEKVKEKFGSDTKVSEHYAFDRNHYAHMALETEYEKWERVYCGYPSQRIIVTASGVCLPCCVDWGQEIEIGSWPRQSLLEIWKGEPMARLRRDLRRGALSTAPKICQNCTSYMAYKRPEREWVQDREGKASINV
jgi:hypothetical protein